MGRVPAKRPAQLSSDADRKVLEDYLNKRLKVLAKEKKRAPEREDRAFIDGAELEVMMALDELLDLQGVEAARKPARRN